MHRSSINTIGVFANDETFSLESMRLGAGQTTGIVSCESDLVLLFIQGELQIKTGDRTHIVSGSAQAYINAGISFEIISGDSTA